MGPLQELSRSIDNASSMENKLRLVEELNNMVRAAQSINDQLCSGILSQTADLLEKSQPEEVRRSVWRLYISMVQGHAENPGQLRYFLFDLIGKHNSRCEDIPYRIELLIGKHLRGSTFPC